MESKNELPLIITKTFAPCIEVKPKEEIFYLIYAYNRINNYWSKRESEYFSYEKAVEVSKTLSRIWEHIRIVEIKLP